MSSQPTQRTFRIMTKHFGDCSVFFDDTLRLMTFSWRTLKRRFHRGLQSVGRLLGNKRSCLDKVGKEQLEKLDRVCWLLPGCFGWSASHGHVDAHPLWAGVCRRISGLDYESCASGWVNVCVRMFVFVCFKLSASWSHWSKTCWSLKSILILQSCSSSKKETQ